MKYEFVLETGFEKPQKKNNKPTTRVNSFMKILVLHGNIFTSSLGLLMLGLGLYFILGDWGSLENYFFFGAGLIFCLIGLSIFLISFLGCQGVDRQGDKYESSCCTGRKVLCLYQFIITSFLVGMGLILILTLLNQDALESTIVSLETAPTTATGKIDVAKMPDISFKGIEVFLSEKFNGFFFGATTYCEGSSNQIYPWFWAHVNNICPSTMSQINCQQCFSYQISTCQANEEVCRSATLEDYKNFACPYTICREELLVDVQDNLSIVLISLGCILGLVFILWFANMMLSCFTPRDSIERILIKSGIAHPKRNEEKKEHLKKLQRQQSMRFYDEAQKFNVFGESFKGDESKRAPEKDTSIKSKASYMSKEDIEHEVTNMLSTGCNYDAERLDELLSRHSSFDNVPSSNSNGNSNKSSRSKSSRPITTGPTSSLRLPGLNSYSSRLSMSIDSYDNSHKLDYSPQHNDASQNIIFNNSNELKNNSDLGNRPLPIITNIYSPASSKGFSPAPTVSIVHSPTRATPVITNTNMHTPNSSKSFISTGSGGINSPTVGGHGDYRPRSKGSSPALSSASSGSSSHKAPSSLHRDSYISPVHRKQILENQGSSQFSSGTNSMKLTYPKDLLFQSKDFYSNSIDLDDGYEQNPLSKK